jgi:hypothetical protein
MSDDPAEPFRCSSFARSEDLDPVGSAGSYSGVVLAEIPLPWPREVTEHPTLAPVAGALETANMRLQALAPDSHGNPDRRRLASFTRPAGAFDRHRGRSWTVADDRVTGAIAAIAASGGTTAGPNASRPETGGVPGGVDAGRHVLVCTQATVEIVRIMPVPDCGKPPEPAPKSAPELRVSGFAAA